jgi:hypothetical protein
MKRVLLLLITLLTCAYAGYAQTVVSGSVLSITGDPLPIATVDIASSGPTDIFSVPGKQFADPDGQFRIIFRETGLYDMTVRGVFHKTVTIPIMIYDQDQISITIQLLPSPYKNGNYFDKEPYLNWIRAYGNFNTYDFFSGEIFRKNSDGSISAFIKTDLDTIRYQVRGLSNGASVLPGADDYAVRNRSFEALLYNTGEADSVELRFHPDEKPPYFFELPDGLSSRRLPLSAFLYFPRPSDKYWVQPLEQINSTFLRFRTISNTKVSDLPDDIFKKSFFDSYDWFSTSLMSEYRDSVIQDLRLENLHPQQRSAMLISYVGLTDQLLDRNRYLSRFSQERETDSVSIEVSEAIFDEIIDSVDPRNPVWALNSDAPLTFLEQSDYSPRAVHYAEQMIRFHPDDMVVRNLVLKLIERRAGQYRNIREMPYYSWIVERYGENNLARRAIRTFHQVSK